MHIQMTAGHLRAALSSFGRIVERRCTVPILTGVKFSGNRLVGTNIDIEASCTIPTIGQPKGEAVVDYFALSSLAAHIDGAEEVTLSEEKGLATFTFNGSEYRMPSFPANDFPDFGTVKGVRAETGNLGFVAAMRRIRFAISTEEIRYYLNGAAIVNGRDGRPMLVATDGHRLAMMPIDGVPADWFGAIIPIGAVNHLVMRGHEPISIAIDLEQRRARFYLPGHQMSAKLIDGAYPEVNRVIPVDARPVFAVDRAGLLRVLRRLRSFSEGWREGVKLIGTSEGLRLEIAQSERSAVEHISWGGACFCRAVRGRIQCPLSDLSSISPDRRNGYIRDRAPRSLQRLAYRHHVGKRPSSHRPDADARVRRS
ncbi:hypothetical protein [Mesorhizobium sp. RMAD-H1]|uniref:DNA polymerase III subunit beta family protein n=1 Tax=Mesorhizobium sp. RMAD-H1 TaxID=2587065 RepID=UPI00161D668C|nr:hypothetical protein [Mesorhizobium sp. RMAD-H1]MBB2973969.1 DNA polymerase-3 subunit beta [Mesorhizobium sp. RMAD-H1]